MARERAEKLPLVFLSRLADFFSLVEDTGTWPASLERAVVSFIPKSDRFAPLDLRPISIMSPIYRLWAAAHLPEVMAWQERWIDKAQFGARPKHGTEDVFWSLALKIERSLLLGLPLYGFSLDYAKCFDNLPQEILLKLAEHMGMQPAILQPLRAMYQRLKRRFKCGGGVGKEYAATNGILQGCPLSIVPLNALVSIWCKALRSEVPLVDPSAYVDDTGALATRPGTLNEALAILMNMRL